jgi:hypothetical protein
MGWPVQPLLFFLASCTRNKLIQQIEFLKAENEMLRKRVPKQRIWLKADEKARLLKLAMAIGPEVKHLVTIVTYARSALGAGPWETSKPVVPSGRIRSRMRFAS